VHEVRLHDAIRLTISSFVKLLTEDEESIRSATLHVLHELAGDGGLQSGTIAKPLTQV
jgi:hypothetical protein